MNPKKLSTFSLYKESKYVAKKPDSNGIVDYSDEDNKVWRFLFNRQEDIVKEHGCQAYLKGLDILDMARDRIPQGHEVSEKLLKTTGWQVELVSAVIPFQDFYTLLANKKFPAATFIRSWDEIDYLQEPDIFHEYYGHCPLLTIPEYANFMEFYAKLALTSTPEQRYYLTRLFWFTIEFGLFKEKNKMVSYGGGILSSKNETIYAATDPAPLRQPLDVLTALRTPYRIDMMQTVYFYIEDFHQLFEIQQMDLLKLVEEAIQLGDFPATFPTDDLM